MHIKEILLGNCIFLTIVISPIKGQEKKLYSDIQTGLSHAYDAIEMEKCNNVDMKDSITLRKIRPSLFGFYVAPTKTSLDTLKFNYALDTIICINTFQSMIVGGYKTMLWSTQDTIEGVFNYNSIMYYAPTLNRNFYELLNKWNIRDFLQNYTTEDILLDGESSTVSRVIIKDGKIVDIKWNDNPVILNMPDY